MRWAVPQEETLNGETAARASSLLAEQFTAIHRRTDYLFAVLMILQWLAGIAAALWISPRTWIGSQSEPHVHVWTAVVLGGLLSSLPVYFGFVRPGKPLTRQVIAVAQVTWSALFIHLTGGRIETHFHVFGSLAMLACYRDWRVLVTATVVVALDHTVRGLIWPQSVYGVLTAGPWRVLEHAAWVLFEDAFLLISIRQSVREMSDIANEQARFESMNEELQSARASAEAANRAKSAFLANMSHEIRTPMTAILGFADVLSSSARDPQSIKAASTIKRNGEFLLEIINDILDVSKIEAGKLSVEQIRCSPCQIVSEVAQLMRVRAEAKGLPLIVEYEGELPESITSDPTRIRQILLNLVSNAIKFSDSGEIRLRAQLERSAAGDALMRFDIMDRGIGMSQEMAERLFRPFTQGDVSIARKYGGTGLGLTISKRLAELLGGAISVTSEPNRGSTFSVTIAAGSLGGVRMVSSRGDSLPLERPSKPLTGQTRLSCSVLLADDSPDNQELVEFVLKKSGAKVTLADNGAEAVAKAWHEHSQGTPFDVVLMDMQMPVLDGFAATRELRRRGYAGPIIALTAHAMREDLERCLTAGCDDYASKPIDGRLLELVARYAEQGTPTDTLVDVQS